MGEACSRLDCSTIEDCTPAVGKKHYVWYDCSGQTFKATAPAPTGALSSTAACEEQVVIAQESDVHLTCDKFAVTRNGSQSRENWRRRYMLGRELGAGQTAVVFEAYATTQEGEEVPVSAETKKDEKAAPSLGRRVALKKLNGSGSSMFRQEVRALVQVGVHPHILRLLECFCDGEEDILILEFCDGGDVYDLYARNNGIGFQEALVAQIIRQVLMALDHLNKRNVEHRDLKPENLLLYGTEGGSPSNPHIKLADFGWASLIGPERKPASVPADGVGSLWYAPPELNPPVAGVTSVGSDFPVGKSDLWSVGIITYLLLVGHSPFNLALRITDPRQREDEVLKLAALGNLNTTTRNFGKLSTDARHFIKALIVPQPAARLSVEEAWSHAFIAKHQPRITDVPRPVPSPIEKLQVWRGLDGFQRLSWLSIARAVAEPELLEGPVFKALIAGQQVGAGSAPYLEQLASDLAGTAIPAWFQMNTAWADVIRLAFRYLDGDGDGVLGTGDLGRHIIGDDAEKVSTTWLLRWQGSATPITFSDYRSALWSTFTVRQRVQELGATRPYDGTEKDAIASIVSLDESVEAALQMRFGSIDQVCEKFIETEGTFEGFDVDQAAW